MALAGLMGIKWCYEYILVIENLNLFQLIGSESSCSEFIF